MTGPAWTGREPVEMERDGDGDWRCGNCYFPVSLRWRFCPDCGCEMEEPQGMVDDPDAEPPEVDILREERRFG